MEEWKVKTGFRLGSQPEGTVKQRGNMGKAKAADQAKQNLRGEDLGKVIVTLAHCPLSGFGGHVSEDNRDARVLALGRDSSSLLNNLTGRLASAERRLERQRPRLS